VGNLCGHGIELWGSIKGRVISCWLLKKDSVPCGSYLITYTW
jgi:hypothetical protein